MKRLFLSLLVFLFVNLSLCYGGYGYRTSFIVDHTKVAADQTNFPILVCANGVSGSNCDVANTNLAIPRFKTIANGGFVTSSSGFDIVFFSGSNCTGLLNFQLVAASYVATTGFAEWWVRVDSLSSTVDTTVYACFGNVSVTTDQSSTNTWDSTFKLVQHFPNGTTLTLEDSTVNASNGVKTGTVAAILGQIDGAGSFDGSTGYITNAGYTSDSTAATFSAWVKLTANTGVIISSPGNTGPYMFVDAVSLIQCSCATLNNPAISTSTVTNGAWTKLDCTFSAVPAENKIYKNGAITTLSDAGGTGGYVNGLTGIRSGAWQNATLFTNGIIDNVVISNVARSATWITTEYNNQFSPTTFFTANSGQVVSLGVGRLNLLGVGD